MGDGRKNLKLQPEDHAELKRRKPDDKSFGEWLLEETADDGDAGQEQSESTVSNEDIWNRLDGIGDDIGTLKESITGQPRH